MLCTSLNERQTGGDPNFPSTAALQGSMRLRYESTEPQV